MARPKHAILSIVPADAPPRDPLADKLDELAISMADELKDGEAGMPDKIDGLKALAAYFLATRGKGAAAPAPANAFDGYRAAQGGAE